MSVFRSARPGMLLRLTVAAALALWLAACSRPSPEQLLAQAREQLDRGDRKTAVIHLRNALRDGPDNGEARLLLGLALLEDNDYAGAEKELSRAIELKAPLERALPGYVRALLVLGRNEAVIAEVEKRQLFSPPAVAATRATMGDAHLRLGNRTEAEAAYQRALRAVPDYPPARLGMAVLAALEGRVDEALEMATAVSAAAPGLAEAHYVRADLLLARGDLPGTQQALEAAIAANADYLLPRYALIRLLTETRQFDAAAAQIASLRGRALRDPRVPYLDASLAYRQGDFDRAREQIQLALKGMPDQPAALALAGAIELRKRQFGAAEAHLQKALSRQPSHYGARLLLAQTYLRMGRPERAKDTLQPLVAKGVPRDPGLLLLAGETYLAAGNVKQAEAFFEAVPASRPAEGAAARTGLAMIAFGSGRADEGFRELEAAAELDAQGYRADLMLISGYLRRNENDKALAAVQALEKKQPDNALTFHMYGLVHIARGDREAARRSFEKALQLQPGYVVAAYNLAVLDIADKKPEEARRRFESMIAADPKNDQLYMELARIQAMTGAKPAEIGATLQRAVAANPQSAAARVALIDFHRRSGDNKAALAAAQDALAALPTDATVLTMSGSVQEAAGQANQAVETFKKLVALQPQSVQPLQRLAALHLRLKEPEAAIEVLRRAQRLAPNERDLVPPLIQAYLMAGRPDDALKEARDLQRRDPKFVGGFSAEGDIYLLQGRPAEAEKPYREALRLDPKSTAVAIRLFGALNAAGKSAEADALSRRWLADNPKDAAIRLYFAERELALKRMKPAAAHYEAVLAVEPQNLVALNNLAWIGGQTGDPKALGYAERAARLAPGDPNVLDTYGTLLVRKGDVENGIKALEQARAAAPERNDLRVNYARALISAGRKDEARRELEALQGVKAEFAGKEDVAVLLKGL